MKRYRWMMLLLALACGQREQLVEEKADQLCLNDQLRRGLTVDTLHSEAITQHVSLTGQVSYNPDQVIQFTSWVAGLALQTHFTLGDHVRKGQVLATIQSPELNTLVADAKSTEAALRTAQREYARINGLYADNIAAEMEVVQAAATVEQLEAALSSIRANLSLYHPTSSGTFEIRSPATGYIVSKNLNPGMPINDGDHLFTVSGLDQVWVIANIYATNMQFVQEGMDVAVRTLAYPGEVFHGRISALSQVFDSEERVLKARIELPNTALKLKPGMSADVTVERRTSQIAVAVPANAVIFDDNQYFVVVYASDCDLQLRRLSPVAQDNQWYFVSEGILAGEQVVSRNHLLIYERIKE